jgi:CBS domain-containing protein
MRRPGREEQETGDECSGCHDPAGDQRDAGSDDRRGCATLLQHRISGLPVVGPDGAVIGMVTEGDLLRRIETGTQRRHSHWLEFLIAPGRLAREYTDANARKVSEVMRVDVVSVAPRESLREVVRLMEHHHVKRLPVIEAGRLVGIVSRADLVRALLKQFSGAGSAAGRRRDDR